MQKNENVAKEGQGKAVASLVFGITSIVLSLAWFISIILAILAIIFGALSMKGPGRGKALAGVITGSIGILLGFVFLGAVFLAVPSLQRNQRDNSRKNDVSRLSASVAEYQANNTGNLPTASDLPRNFTIITSVSDGATPSKDTASYISGKNCDGVSSARDYSVTILLEKGTEYCVGS